MKTGVHVYEVENNIVGLPTFLFSTFPTILFSHLHPKLLTEICHN